MKYSVFTVMMPEYSIEETAKILSTTGYDGVEWRIKEFKEPGKGEKPSFWGYNRSTVDVDKLLSFAPELKNLCKEYALEICCLTTYLKIDDKKEKIEQVLKSAKILSCPKVRIGPYAYNRKENYNILYKCAKEKLKIIEKISKEYGVQVVLETHMGSIIPSASLAYRLVQDFDPKYIGVIYDPGNMVAEGIENWRMGMELLGQYLSHVHVKNLAWFFEENNWVAKSVPLREGIVNWREVLTDLKSVGYKGYLSFEDFSSLPTDKKVNGNIKYIKEITAKS